MNQPANRPAKEYQSIGTMDVLTDEKRRDVLIAFQGDPNEENFDLVVRLGSGNVPAHVALLHEASRKLDESATATTEAGQVVMVSGAHALEASAGLCGIQLVCLGFQIPFGMSKETAQILIAELQKAVEAFERGPRQPRRLS